MPLALADRDSKERQATHGQRVCAMQEIRLNKCSALLAPLSLGRTDVHARFDTNGYGLLGAELDSVLSQERWTWWGGRRRACSAVLRHHGRLYPRRGLVWTGFVQDWRSGQLRIAEISIASSSQQAAVGTLHSASDLTGSGYVAVAFQCASSYDAA
jgi:hypothetical protein